MGADEWFDLKLLREAVRYQTWVISSLASGFEGEVLEVGAGTGNFTRWLSRSATRVLALEPEKQLREEIQRLALANVEILPLPLESLEGTAQRFDHVVMINVLEHIPDDSAAIRIAYGLMRPGARISILAPAHPILFGSLDERYGHVRRYTVAGIEGLLRTAGFRVHMARYFNPVGAVGWFLVARLARRPKLSMSSIRFTEHLAVPVGRALHRIGLAPFGQSVIAVGIRTR